MSFFGDLRSLYRPEEFERFLDASVKSNWVVYVKDSFSNSNCVIRYLARYTHRIAISNSRILSIKGDFVALRWKNYRSGGRQEVMQLDGREFMRRFLQHVLPKGFTRIRHFGILSNRVRSETLQLCRKLLAHTGEVTGKVTEKPEQSTANEERDDGKQCPTCQSGRMLIVVSWQRGQQMPTTPITSSKLAMRVPALEFL